MRSGGINARRLVVFCTQGIHDPLVSNLMLEYLLRLQRRLPGREVLLFTEEPPAATADPPMASRLASDRITWVPLTYDIGGWQWLQKFRSGLVMLVRTWRFSKGRDGTWLLGHLVFGGAYAVLLQQLGLGRSVTVCFEPHSLYMVELGIWRREGIRHRLVRALERLQIRKAHALVVPTQAGVDQAKAIGMRGELVLQGITIDVGQARYDGSARASFRQAHRLVDETVLAYVGKFGGIYHSVSQYLTFASRISQVAPDLRFLVIAGRQQLAEISADPAYTAVAHLFILHPPVPPTELHEVLSGADLGVIAVPPTPSQAFRTPVKTAHYWAAGLPIVIPEGVSDDHAIARAERVGIVVKDLPDVDVDTFLAQVRAFRGEDPETLRQRCIGTAMRYRDTNTMVELLARLLP